MKKSVLFYCNKTRTKDRCLSQLSHNENILKTAHVFTSAYVYISEYFVLFVFMLNSYRIACSAEVCSRMAC
jgi:hypothetical protein